MLFQEEVALEPQEDHGALEAGIAVQEDTVKDPEEVRTKNQASATGTTTKSDAATEASTADVLDEVKPKKQQI